MSRKIKKICVVGAGVMGSAIAAHMANSGFSCLLLDIVPKEGDRNLLAQKGLQNALKAKPAAFMHPSFADRVEIGNLEDDLHKIRDCDWVIEAILEKLPLKQALFAKIEPLLSPHAIVSSNTSGLSIDEMLIGRSEAFKQRFLVTHFFNPVRYMHLFELVVGPKTDPKVVAQIQQVAETQLGKGVVFGKDTPNFVANRVGVFSMMEVMRVMQADDYSIEEVDAVFGPATGRPKSAVFRTADVVGLDTFVHVAQNCFDHLPNDERHAVFEVPAFMREMVQRGMTGQKSGKGFYQKQGKDIVVLDLGTLEYRAKEKVRYESLGQVRKLEKVADKIRVLFEANDRAGALCYKVTASTCIYAANRLFEIADDLVQIDNAMKWGFNWEQGPFETWDALGVRKSCERMQKDGYDIPAWVSRMLALGRESFYALDNGTPTVWDARLEKARALEENPRLCSLEILKRTSKNIVQDDFATTLIDLGDGVLACEFHTKMNAIDADVIKGINKALDRCEAGEFEALVLANDGTNFSVGANILLLYMAAQGQDWQSIDDMVKGFQSTCQRLYYSPIPTVAAPFQMTFGGGAELSMWCNQIQAHAELYMGLVEVGVGLIPGGGGNIAMLARTLENAPDDPSFVYEPLIKRAFETVAMAKVSISADDARALGYLRTSDGITMNRRELLMAAKARALGMVQTGYRTPSPRQYRVLGQGAYATFDMVLGSMLDGHFISEHDRLIARKIAHVMTGGHASVRAPVSEQYLLDLEREAFLSLCSEAKTQERIAYMLEHSKPLRN